MVRKRSCPAVSQICSLTRLPSSSIVRILKSMPMVVMKEGVKLSSLNLNKQHDLPTPESPMSSSLICARQQLSEEGLEKDRQQALQQAMLPAPRKARGEQRSFLPGNRSFVFLPWCMALQFTSSSICWRTPAAQPLFADCLEWSSDRRGWCGGGGFVACG